MRTFRDSVAQVTFPLKKQKKIRGDCPLCVPSPCGDVVLKLRSYANRNVSISDCFRPLAGMMFYQPPPSKRGRWRATRAGRGACVGCRFLTIERQYRSWRPYHRCAIPLPRGERSTSSNHTSLTLVFLGRFPIRPVSQSASSYGLASWTGQQRGRLGFRVSVPLRGCGFEIINAVVVCQFLATCFRPRAGMWF